MRTQRYGLAGAVLAVLLALPAGVSAVEPDEVLTDPHLEARARTISTGLRCPVCQNQSIDDSNAPLARDLRFLVRERLKAGDSDAAVRHYIVDRYGDFVLLRPRLTGPTLLLWLAPALILLGAAWFVLRRVRTARPAANAAATSLSPEEEARLAAHLRARE
ncbi:MAG: cytochrome c-type biogenesis protein [Hyphomicrobiaceae bacterium]